MVAEQTWRETIEAVLAKYGGTAPRDEVIETLIKERGDKLKDPATAGAILSVHTGVVGKDGSGRSLISLKPKGGGAPVATVTPSPAAKPVVAAPEPAPEPKLEVPEEMKQYIPKRHGEYIPRKLIKDQTDWDLVWHGYHDYPKVKGHKANLLMVGPTGTGKTHLFEALAAELGVPYIALPLNGGTTVEDLLGQWVPSMDGKMIWVDGLLTRFVRYGGIVVLDEVNAAPNEVKFAIHCLTDKRRQLVLTGKDGEVVKAHSSLMVAGTMNEGVGYDGTQNLNLAFKDRFDIVINLSYDLAVDRKVLKDCPYRDGILAATKKLRDMTPNEVTYPVSTRALEQLCLNMKVLGIDAALWTFAQRFPEDERRAVLTVMEAELSKYRGA